VEDHKYFQLAEEIPDENHGAGGAGQERGVVIVASLFEKRSAGLYHNTAAIIERTARILVNYPGRCTSRTTRFFTEKFYFTPGDLGFQRVD